MAFLFAYHKLLKPTDGRGSSGGNFAIGTARRVHTITTRNSAKQKDARADHILPYRPRRRLCNSKEGNSLRQQPRMSNRGGVHQWLVSGKLKVKIKFILHKCDLDGQELQHMRCGAAEEDLLVQVGN